MLTARNARHEIPGGPQMAVSPAPRPLPLADVRILDLTRRLPGAYATQMLADLGASVLKIEEPGLGDYARSMPPLKDGIGQFFVAVNRNKRSAAVNLKQPAG